MRTFFAIPLPESLKTSIDKQLIPLKELHPGFKWVNPKNYHLTLHFLGNISDNEYGRLVKALKGFKLNIPPFKLSFGRIGAFPQLSNPSILYISVLEGVESAQMIYNSLSQLLSKANIKSDIKKKFIPHLTICRIRKTAPNYNFEFIKQVSIDEQYKVKYVQLFSSDLSGKSPIYTPLVNLNL